MNQSTQPCVTLSLVAFDGLRDEIRELKRLIVRKDHQYLKLIQEMEENEAELERLKDNLEKAQRTINNLYVGTWTVRQESA